MEKEQTGNVTPEKKARKRRSGEYRYQVKSITEMGDVSWSDSVSTFKGPAEALAAASKESAGAIVRSVRVASPEFELEAVTTTAMKRVK